MSESAIPKVSIGLPVYNGEQYIETALQSILQQDFDDFELVVSDNASADATPYILDRWADKDERVTVHHSDINVGGADNFNKVLQLSTGKYFRWATHDDYLAPSMVSSCVEALDAAEETCVLVYPQTVIVDGDGNEVEMLSNQLILDSDDPVERLHEFMRNYGFANAIYGLMRADAIKAVGGLPKYNAGDLTMIAGLALRGKFLEVPEPLFYRRMHEDMSWRKSKTPEGFAKWFDPNKRWFIVFQAWRLWRELVGEVWRSPLSPADKLRATGVVAYAWPRREWKRMLKEIARIPIVVVRQLRQARSQG